MFIFYKKIINSFYLIYYQIYSNKINYYFKKIGIKTNNQSHSNNILVIQYCILLEFIKKLCRRQKF